MQVSGDFTRLSAQYNGTSTPTSPAKSNVTAGTTNCPVQNSTLLASTDLPPTPDDAALTAILSLVDYCRVRRMSRMLSELSLSESSFHLFFDTKLTSLATHVRCSVRADYHVMPSLVTVPPGLMARSLCALPRSSFLTQCRHTTSTTRSTPAVTSRATQHLAARVSAAPLYRVRADYITSEPNTAQDASNAAASCLNSVPSGGVFTPTAVAAIASTSYTSSGSSSSSSSSNVSSHSKSGASRIGLGGWTPIALSMIGAVIGGAWVLA